jgi:polyisoprenoid-binding protein YceI
VGFAAQHLVVGRVRGRFERLAGTVTIADDPAACVGI